MNTESTQVEKSNIYRIEQSALPDESFPRILVIGLSFNQSSGSGITLTNLFKKWDKSRLAIASENIDDNDHQMSDHVYQLGYEENKRRFPFYLFQKKMVSGTAKKPIETSQTETLPSKSYHKRFPFLVKYYNRFLHFFGLYHYSRRLRISKKIALFVQDFQPDIIYTHANEFDIMQFTLDLKQAFSVQVTTHIMDHYIDNYFNQKGLLYQYWQNKVGKTFKKLIDHSALCFSIGEEMSKAYSKKYSKNFTVFHNGLDFDLWKSYRRTDHEPSDPFTILYAGRITVGTNECLLQIAEAIDELPEKNKIRFHIQTTSVDPILEKLAAYSFVHIAPVAQYAAIPKILSGADLLLLAHNFDDFTRTYFCYSFPTKAPEYMITGVPVLLYAPEEVAVTKHARKYHWAYIINSPDKKRLTGSIQLFYNDASLRRSYGLTAHEFALTHYNIVDMQEKFRLTFANACT